MYWHVIQKEIDRDLSKKKRTTSVQVDGKKEDFTVDKRKMEHYSNLFYILQTEPKYLAKLYVHIQIFDQISI